MKSVKTGQFRSFPVIRNPQSTRLLCALSRIKCPPVKQHLKNRSVHSSSLPAAKNKDLEPTAIWWENSEEYVCDVRTGILKPWFAFELIGTLKGKEAEKAARWTVHQEYYRVRSKLQLSLLKELRSKHPDFPIKAEKFDKIEESRSEVGNPVPVVLTSLEEWFTICVYSLGVNETRRVIALAIETACEQAKQLVYDAESKVSQNTKSVCTDELLSKIKVIHDKRESTSAEKTEDHATIAKENGVLAEKVIKISLPLREKIHNHCLKAAIDAVTNHAKSKFGHLLPKTDTVAEAGANNYPSGFTNKTSDRIRYSLRCHGPGVEQLRSQIQNGVQITQFLDGIHDPFEGIPEDQIFKDGVRIIERILTVPKAKHIWFSIRDPEYKTGETVSFEKQGDLKFSGFTSTVVRAMEKQDSEWDSLELSEQQLVAFLVGMSEYLCDDFGLKSRLDSKSMIFYPTDTPLKLGWLPQETVLCCEGVKGDHQLPLSPQMIQELKKMCDFLIESVSDLVLISPPLPRYILEQAEVKNRKTRTLQTLFFTSLVILLGLWYGLSRKTEVTERLNKAQVYISETITAKKFSN